MSTLTWSLLAIAAFLLVVFLSTRTVRRRHRDTKAGDGTTVTIAASDTGRSGDKTPDGHGGSDTGGADGGGGGGGGD